MADFLDLSKNIPSYLNVDFFSEIFKKSKILNFSIATASKPGDNFVGAVYRVTITTSKSDEKSQLIVKVPSNSGHETLHSYLSTHFVDEAFKTEIQMYETILPEMEKLWKNAGYEDKLCPRMIHQTTSPQPTIVLEDVSPFGYKTLNRPTEDFEVSKMIAKRLAKFHAASYYLVNEKNHNYSSFTGSVFNNPILCRIIFDMGLEGFIHVASQKDSLCQYVEKLKILHGEFEERIKVAYKPSENGINVLCHNDFHLKNVLFGSDGSEKIKDFYIIDYQLCNFTSPALDLIYALYYFVSSENRKFHRESFITTYYNQFSQSLIDFKFSRNIPSRKMLDDEFKKCAAHEIMTAICLSIFFYFDLSNLQPEDLDMGEGTMKAKYRMFENEEFLEMIKWQLEEFEDREML